MSRIASMNFPKSQCIDTSVRANVICRGCAEIFRTRAKTLCKSTPLSPSSAQNESNMRSQRLRTDLVELWSILGRLKAIPIDDRDGSLILMVTHKVTVTAVTGVDVDSGGIVAYDSKTGEAKLLKL